MTVKCVMCDKTWEDFDRNNVVVHHRDDHQGNLMFISDEELAMMVEEVPEPEPEIDNLTSTDVGSASEVPNSDIKYKTGISKTPPDFEYAVTKKEVEMLTLRKDEADVVIFRIGTDTIPASQEALDQFAKYVKPIFEDLDIPVLVVPKATVEVKVVNQYDLDLQT